MRRPPRISTSAGCVAALLMAATACFNAASDGPPHPRDADPLAEGRVTPTGPMAAPRAAHTATLLPGGTVLLAGGMSRSERHYAAGAERYDPATDAFQPAGAMHTPRASHTATLLPDSTVLLTGGFGGDYLAGAEVYDPATGAFTPTGAMTAPRAGHTATLLDDGTVLVAGGAGTDGQPSAGAEVYDPATGAFRPTGAMTAPRAAHTATLLHDGRVLLAGGHAGRRATLRVHADAEVYDPATGAFTPTGGMGVVRHKHAAVRLRDGRVLVAGGSDRRDWHGRHAGAEVYDPTTGAFAATGPMHAARFKIQGAGVLLPDGRVLVAGGAEQAERYDPETGSFRRVAGRLGLSLSYSTATLLPNGEVLLAGGYDEAIDPRPNAWRYRP